MQSHQFTRPAEHTPMKSIRPPAHTYAHQSRQAHQSISLSAHKLPPISAHAYRSTRPPEHTRARAYLLHPTRLPPLLVLGGPARPRRKLVRDLAPVDRAQVLREDLYLRTAHSQRVSPADSGRMNGSDSQRVSTADSRRVSGADSQRAADRFTLAAPHSRRAAQRCWPQLGTYLFRLRPLAQHERVRVGVGPQLSKRHVRDDVCLARVGGVLCLSGAAGVVEGVRSACARSSASTASACYACACACSSTGSSTLGVARAPKAALPLLLLGSVHIPRREPLRATATAHTARCCCTSCTRPAGARHAFSRGRGHMAMLLLQVVQSGAA
jgi:hypothetical protein